MTQNATAWFVERFETTVHHEYQQTERRLGGTVAGGGTFVGDKAYFPRLGAVEAYDSARFQQLNLANFAQDFIELTCSPKFIAFGLWDPDAHKYSIATADEYAKEAANAIVRVEDDCIIDSLADAAANGVKTIGANTTDQIETLGDYNSVADLDLVAEAVALLGEQEAFAGEEITAVQPFRNKIQYSLDPYMANNNVRGNMPWNDLNWRHSERLPRNGDGTGVDTFVYAKRSIVSGYNDKLVPINERDGKALTDIRGYWLQVGAKARSAKGIIRIKTKRSFSLSRAPIQVFDQANV